MDVINAKLTQHDHMCKVLQGQMNGIAKYVERKDAFEHAPSKDEFVSMQCDVKNLGDAINSCFEAMLHTTSKVTFLTEQVQHLHGIMSSQQWMNYQTQVVSSAEPHPSQRVTSSGMYAQVQHMEQLPEQMQTSHRNSECMESFCAADIAHDRNFFPQHFGGKGKGKGRIPGVSCPKGAR